MPNEKKSQITKEDISKSKILIVHDNEQDFGEKSLLSKLLVEEFKVGHLEQTNSVDEALERLKTTEFEIVMIDVLFPNGADILELVQAMHHQHSMVIMMGHEEKSDTSIISKCFKQGANDFLSTPLTKEKVESCIVNALEERIEFKNTIVETNDNIKSFFKKSAVSTPIDAIVQQIEKLLAQRYTERQLKAALTAILKSLGDHNLFKPTTNTAIVKNVPWLGEYNVIDKTTRAVSKSVSRASPKKGPTTDIQMQKGPLTPKLDQGYRFPPPPQEKKQLKDLDKFSFDLFECDIDDKCRGIEQMFEKLGLMTDFSINSGKLTNFIQTLRVNYNSNHYHNFDHAFDVTQFVYSLLNVKEIAEILSSPLDKLTVMIAALCHDICHPGTNNAFQVKTHSTLAMRFNDIHVLENMHAQTCFQLLGEDQNNIIENVSDQDYPVLREGIIKSILATDPAEHFAILVKFQTRMKSGEFGKGENGIDKDDKFLVMAMVLKSADISNVCRPFDIASKWGEKIVREFIQQGDKEKELGLAVTPIMDREKMNKAQSQIGFMDYIAAPWYEALGKYWPSLAFLKETMDSNKTKWLEIKKKQEEDGTTPSYKDVVVCPQTPARPTLVLEEVVDYSKIVKNCGIRVLIVSSHMKSLDVCKQVLFQAGYISDMASSLKEAQPLIKKRVYQLIVLSLGVFDIDPFCQSLKNTVNSATSTLFISDEPLSNPPEMVTVYASKPLHVEEFFTKVDACVAASLKRTPVFNHEDALHECKSEDDLKALLSQSIIPSCSGLSSLVKKALEKEKDFAAIEVAAKNVKILMHRLKFTVMSFTAYLLEKAARERSASHCAVILTLWKERFVTFIKDASSYM